MPNLITAKIDLTLVDMTRLFEGKKLNRKGLNARYLDIVLMPTPNNAFGDTHMIVQSITKEERESGMRGEILGNAKEKGGEGVQADAPQRPPARRAPTTPPPPPQENIDEDVPF